MRKLMFFALLMTVVISSCKKDEETTTTGLTDAMARDSLYYVMREWYYWYDRMPSVNKEDYADPYKLLDGMRYLPVDRWSFVADYNEFISEMQGEFVGHGIRIGLDNTNKARIAMIYSRSPLYASGVRRGWIIKTINGYDIAQILKDQDAVKYNTALGPSTEGITNKFIFTKPDGSDIEISSTKTKFTVNSVILYDTLHLASGVTGHLVFDAFIQPSADELATAFAYFKANDVKDLILDLRYNGGGYLYIAQALASYIAGNAPASAGSAFATLKYNAKHQEQNSVFTFKSTSTPMALTRLLVITTRNTASASEAVMNGLKPFMTVVSVGDTTNGKPVGMNGWEVGKKYFYWPITFKMVNNKNEGDYFDGIVPGKISPDDITHDFNDRREACLKEAIQYLETGSFSSKGAAVPFYRYKQYSEKPEWMSRGLLLNN